MVWKTLFLNLLITTTASFSHAAVLQEGWYKVISSRQAVGFVVLRYEFNESKKQFITTSYTQTGALAGNIKESLTATSAQNLDPISYQFTSTIGQLVKTIDASFSKGVMSAKVSEAGKVESIQNKLQKGTFLSQFLVYLILQNPKGLKVGNKFAYSAIAEEDAKISEGEAYVAGMEKVNGIDAYKILVTFKGAKFISYVTPKGNMLLSKQPTEGLSIELTNGMDDAIKGFEVNKKTLTLLFKTLPASTPLQAKAPEAAEKPAEKPTEKLTEKPVEPEPNYVDSDKIKKLNQGSDTTTPQRIFIPPGKGNPGKTDSN